MSNDESDKGNTSDNEWVFIAIKEDDPIPFVDLASSMNVERVSAAQVEEKVLARDIAFMFRCCH